MPHTDAEPDAGFHPPSTTGSTDRTVDVPLSPRPAGRRLDRRGAPDRDAMRGATGRPDWPTAGHSPED